MKLALPPRRHCYALSRMLSLRPTFAAWSTRLLVMAGLLALATLSLVDRGATRMYAAPWSYLYWLALLVPPALVVLRAFSPDRPWRLPASRWSWLVAVAAAALVGAACASPYRAVALHWSALPLSGLAVFLLIHDWLNTAPENAARLTRLWVISTGGLMLASSLYWFNDLFHLTRAYLFSSALFEMRNGHPLGHSNYTAGLAVLSLPWLVHAGFRERGLVRRIAILGVALTLLVLFTCGSRGGWLGVAALGVAALAGARLGWKRFTLLAAAAIIAAGLLAMANPRIRALLVPADPSAPPNISTTQRTAMLAAGWRMGWDRPLLGWGLHTTPLVYPRCRARLDGGAENVLQLHSAPVEIWAGLGATGLVLLGAFLLLAAQGRSRAPVAATALAGYGVFALTDYQLDVPVFVLAVAALAAQQASPGSGPAGPKVRFGLAGAALVVAIIIAGLGHRDPTPELNGQALELAREPAQHTRAIALLHTSLDLNPAQEIAHFNLGWLLVVSAPAEAERHFQAAARLVPDKGGVYFGLGLARLNQGNTASAARAFALECLNDPLFLASPWWTVPAIAAERNATTTAFIQLTTEAGAALPASTWAARQTVLLATLAPRLGLVSPGPEQRYRRERTGYPVLMRDLDLAPPIDLYDVREDPRFPATVPFPLPPKGWLPSPLLLKLLDAGASSSH
jgi:O-antigen ligase